MPDFRTYWQQKEAKLRENWDARYKSFIAKHCSLEEIRETVLRPADYAWNFADQASFLSTYFTAANPMAEWHEGQFSFSESALRQALKSEEADVQTFKMEVERISIRGMEAPKPKPIDAKAYNGNGDALRAVREMERRYHAWLEQRYKVCVAVETVTITYRQAMMTIKRYVLPDTPLGYYEIYPCKQLMQLPLLMEETGFMTLDVPFMLMDMAAEWELRNEEFRYYAKQLKIRQMEYVTTGGGINLEGWDELSREERLARIELFMSYATDAGSDADRINMWYWGRRNINYVMKYDLMPYLRKAGMKEVICSHIGGKSIFPELKDDVIVMEYQGRRAAITCHDHYPVTCIRFYPNYPWTTPLSPSEREGHYIDFQVLALNAVTVYLKLMPTLLWEAE
jgi:hypothetical protein